MNMQDPNKFAVESIRQFIIEDAMEIRLMSLKRQTPEFAKISVDAILDLLSIRYHRRAQILVSGYSLTYDELRKKVKVIN
jgi:uncharacterized protein YfbU (UPF0304 family)